MTADKLDLTLIQDIKNFLQTNNVKKTFRVGTEIFNAIQPFIEKPSWWNIARSAIGCGKVFVDDIEIWSSEYFSDDTWCTPFSRDFTPTIMPLLERYPFMVVKTAEDSVNVRIIDLDGVKAGWLHNNSVKGSGPASQSTALFVETSGIVQARETIKKLLWKKYGNKPLVLSRNRGSVLEDTKVTFEFDDNFHPLSSAKATEYGIYLKRCLDAGVPRAVMLCGPPGTGKSTMARTLVDSLKMRSFRIRVEDVSGLQNSTLFEAISTFKPDAVILDDFDRAHAQDQLLETLEFFQRHVKLVIATVNNIRELDDAILRPGRFDEIVVVDMMDEGVVRHILGEYVDGFERVKEWPVAFIHEYVKRRKFMSAEEAEASTEELAIRVKKLDKYKNKDEDDVDRMLKVVKAQHTPEEKSALEQLEQEIYEEEHEDET